jgi:hypothetical protein
MFLPYHSEWRTWLHRGLLALDLALVWTLWPAYRSGWGVRLWPKATWWLVVPGIGSAAALAFAVLVAIFPDERIYVATHWLHGSTDLNKVDGAQLQGTFLDNARLQGALLDGAQLQAPCSTACSSRASRATARSSRAPCSKARSSRPPRSMALSSRAPCSTARSSRAPRSTACSSRAPRSSARSSRAPCSKARSSRARHL